jgi:hypothetical protein
MVAELTLTIAVVDLPGFFGVVEEGAFLGIGFGIASGAGAPVEAGAGASIGAGVLPVPPPVPGAVVPPLVPGVVKSCALGPDIPPGDIPPPEEGIFIPGAAGVTGVVVVGS